MTIGSLLHAAPGDIVQLRLHRFCFAYKCCFLGADEQQDTVPSLASAFFELPSMKAISVTLVLVAAASARQFTVFNACPFVSGCVPSDDRRC